MLLTKTLKFKFLLRKKQKNKNKYEIILEKSKRQKGDCLNKLLVAIGTNKNFILGVSQLLRKLFVYEQLVKHMPSMTALIERALKTEESIIVFMKKVF